MSDKRFYIYEHYDDLGRIFYVGKGCKNRAYVKEGRNAYWNNWKNKYGLNVRLLVENLTNELALLCEVERIDQLRKMGVSLTNLTEGGEGVTAPSEEVREKMRQNTIRRNKERAGKPISQARKDQLKIAQEAAKNTPKSEEFKQAVRSRLTGGTIPEEVRKKISDSHLKLSDQKRERYSGANNPSVDKRYYLFENDSTKEQLICTRSELGSIIGRGLNSLFKKNPFKKYKGWVNKGEVL